VERAEVAHQLHPARQLRAGLRRAVDLLGVRQRLLGGHRAHPRLLHLGDLIDHHASELDLGLLGLAAREAQALRQQEDVHQPEGQQATQLEFVVQAHALERQDRVREPADLIGQREVDRALRDQGLQRRAVGQGHLDGIALGQRPGQQVAGQRGALVALFLRAAEFDLAVSERRGAGVGFFQGVIDADGGAAGQGQGHRRHGAQAEGRLHGWPFRGAMGIDMEAPEGMV